jgi:hypothetical protein
MQQGNDEFAKKNLRPFAVTPAKPGNIGLRCLKDCNEIVGDVSGADNFYREAP